jgi:SAM-dependent methyltransferase
MLVVVLAWLTAVTLLMSGYTLVWLLSPQLRAWMEAPGGRFLEQLGRFPQVVRKRQRPLTAPPGGHEAVNPDVHSGGRSTNAERYFAAASPDTFERKRLALLTHLADPISTGRLNRLGVGPGWNCLEVGAGEGSVARWLASRVGPQGRVVATDLNLRFLAGHGLPGVEARRHDILTDDLEPAHYDLVHCRFVLRHVAEPMKAIARMVAAVRPGGWLLVEEADDRSYGAADSTHPRAAEFDRRTRALHVALQTRGVLDSTIGRRLSALAEEFDLRDAAHEGTTLIGRGGGALARFYQMSQQLLRGVLVSAGALTEEDLDALHWAYDDPSFWFIGSTVFGAWGRRHGTLSHAANPLAETAG